MCYNKLMDRAYDINPLDANFIFQVGQPIIIVLFAFVLITGVLGFVGRVMSITTLDVQAGKWLSRFTAILLYVVLFWLGLTMLISYFGRSVLDVINGAILLTGAVVSLVQRAYSDQRAANRTLAFAFGFLGFVFLWHFIYGSVMYNLPAQFLSAIGNALQPEFFTHLFKAWGWA